MAISHHLGFYQTANSVLRSTDPENPWLEPNMEWIGSTVCEIFAFTLYCDLETGVRGHSRSPKVALFDTAHTTLYSYSIVTICFYLFPFPRYSRILVENRSPLYLSSDLHNDPWWRETRMMDLSDGERISMTRSAVLIQSTHMTDGQTDRQTELQCHIRVCCHALKRKENWKKQNAEEI